MNLAEKVFYPNFLQKCRVDKDIPESVFIKNARIRELDQYLFQLYFLNANLRFVFRPYQGDLPKIESMNKERNEIHILEMEIMTRSDGWRRIYKFAKAIFESYPYPLLLILRYKDEFCFFTAVTHENSRKSNRYVSDSLQGSGWFTSGNIEQYNPPEEYYIMMEQHFDVQRNTLKLIPKVMTEQTSIRKVLESWHQIAREDRAQWAYFYHMSDEYRLSDSVIGSIISRSKRIEEMYDEGFSLFDCPPPTMDDNFWFEEDEYQEGYDEI